MKKIFTKACRLSYAPFSPATNKLFFAIAAMLMMAMSGQLQAQTAVPITTSGTWTVPAGVTSATFYIWGGGGGGGGCSTSPTHYGNGGGGGGSACGYVTVSVYPGDVYTATIGAGGTAGTAAGANGGTGGTTTFTRTTAQPGSTGAAGPWTVLGGSGGLTSNGVSGSTFAGGAAGTSGTGTGIAFYAGGNGSLGKDGTGNGAAQNVSGTGGGAGGSGAAGSGAATTGTASTCAAGAFAGGTGTYPGGAGGYNAQCGTQGNQTTTYPGAQPGGGGAGDVAYTSTENGGVGGAGEVMVVYTPAPVLTVSLSSLTFSANQCSLTPSVGQSFTVSGTNLTGYPANITVTAPSTSYQVSNNNSTWGNTATIAYSSATLASTTVYVRFVPQSTGSYTGNVTFSGGGVSSPPTLAVSGTGVSCGSTISSGDGVNWVGGNQNPTGFTEPTNCSTSPFNMHLRHVAVSAGSTATDGRVQWFTTLNSQASGGDVYNTNMNNSSTGFLFTSGGGCGNAGNYGNKWGSGSSFSSGTDNAVNATGYQAANNEGLDMSTAGYYSFTMKDNGYNTTGYYVGYTAARPVAINYVSSSNTCAGPTITCSLSAAPSSGENIFIRYQVGSNSNFSAGTGTTIANTIVQGTVSGTTGTFVLPSQSPGAVIYFYLFTSTESAATLNAANEGDKAYNLINYDDNSGNLYTFTVPSGTSYTWIGASGGSWATSTNWSPTGVPTCGDAVIFNSVATITNVPTLTLTSMTTTTSSGAAIILQPVSGGATVTLTNSGTALSIDGSSSITLNPNNGSDILAIAYSGSGNTATIAGTLALTSGSTGAATYNATNSATSVSGTFNINDAHSVVTSTGSNLTVASGGNLSLNNAASAVPTATWSSGSTLTFTGSALTFTGLGQSFYNVTYNSSTVGVNPSFGGALTSVAGTLTVTNTSSGAASLLMTTNSNYTASIANIVVNGGQLFLTYGTGTATVNVSGNVTVSSSNLFISGLSANAALNLTGASSTLAMSGGAIQVVNAAGNGTINLSNSGSSFNITGGTLYMNGTLGTNTTTAIPAITAAGSFSISAGTINWNGAALAGYLAGSINVAGNFSSTGSAIMTMTSNPTYPGAFYFNGSSSQSLTCTSTGTMRFTNYHVSNGSNCVLSSSFGIISSSITGYSDTLFVHKTGTLNCGAYNINENGNAHTKGVFIDSGTLIIGDPNGITALGTASGNILTTLQRYFYNYAANNYTYAGTAAQVTGTGLPATINGALTINNSSGVTLTQATTTAGTLVLTSGLLTLGSINLTNSGTISGYGPSNYILTNGTGQLIQTVTTSSTPVFYPVGSTTAYDPFAISTSSSSATYGVISNSAAPTPVNDPTEVVIRTWSVYAGTAGVSMVPTAYWNRATEEASNFESAAGVTPVFGIYNNGAVGVPAWYSYPATLTLAAQSNMAASASITLPATATAYTLAVGGIGTDSCFDGTPSVVALGQVSPIAGGNIAQKTTNNVIQAFTLMASSSNATLSGMTFTATGTYTNTTDLSNFKLWYNASSNSMTGASLVATDASPSASGSSNTFTVSGATILAGTTGYFFITCDLPCATIGHTVIASALSTANFTFLITPTFSGSAAAGGSQAIIAGGPVKYTWANPGTGGSWATAANWTPNGVPGCGTGDTAVFSGTGSETITNVPTATLGGLYTTGAVSVTLQPVSGGATLTLSNAGTALSIISGSTITLNPNNGTDVLAIAYSGSGNTASVAGTLAVTSGGTGAATYNATNSATTISGTFNVNDAVSVVTSTTGNLTISATGNVNMNNAATAIPTATWSSGSTVTLAGSSVAFTGLGQSFSNFTLNSSTTTAAYSFGGALTTIGGNFTMTASNGKGVSFGTTTSETVNIGGNLSVTASTLILNGGTGSPIINVTGNVIVSGGNLRGNTSTGTCVLNIGGSVTLSGGNMELVNNNSATATTTMNVTGTSSAFNITGGILYMLNYTTVAAGGSATINMTGASSSFNMSGGTVYLNYDNDGSPTTTQATVNLSGSFSLTGGTWFWNDEGATYPSGVLNVAGSFNVSGTATMYSLYMPMGEVNFTGSSQSISSSGFTGTMDYTSFRVASGSTCTLSGNFAIEDAASTIADSFLVMSGGTLICGTNNVNDNSSGHGRFYNYGTLVIGSSAGISSLGTASGNVQTTGLRVYDGSASTSNYTYAGSSSQLTGTGLPSPLAGTLTINNSSGVQLSQSTTVNGTLLMSSGNFDLNGSNNITLGATATFTGESCSNAIINSGTPTATNGWIGTTRTLAANPGNVANLGINFTTASAMGSTVIKRFPKPVSTSALLNTTNYSIKRIYTVTPTTATTGTVSEGFTYCTSELNGNVDGSGSTPGLAAYTYLGTNETTNSYTLKGAVSDVNPTVTVPLSFPTGTTCITFANADKYCTANPTDWNTPSTWTANIVPPAYAPICIGNAITNNSVSTANTGNITFNGGGSLSIGSGLSVNVAAGDSLINSSGSTATISGSGNVNFTGAGTIAGANATTISNVVANGGLTLATVPTISGSLQINTNGYVSTAPIYGSSSTLVYNIASGSYGVSSEWTGNGTTASSGIPQNVTIQNGTTLNMPTTSRGLAGNMNITSGTLFLNASSGDLYVGGNWTRGASGTFTPNNRAVFFDGAGTQVVSVTGGGTETFNYLLAGSNGSSSTAGTVQLSSSPATNVVVDSSGGLTLASSNATSTIDLNGQTLTLSGSGNLNLNAGNEYITSTIAGGKLQIINNSVATSNFGTLGIQSGAILDLQNGFNCGYTGSAGVTTINGTLEIDGGGYVNTSAPIYGTGSTLNYNAVSGYTAGQEWYQNTYSQPGVPYNVTLTNNASMNFGGESYQHEMWGSLNIGSGSSLSLASSGTGPSPDLYIKGNWVNSGSFNCNGHLVQFLGTTAQTLTGATTFDYLQMNNSAGLTLNSNATVNTQLIFSSGVITTTSGDSIVVLNTASGALSGYSATNGYVNGKLMRYVASSTSYDFPVGSSTNYELANITFSSGLTGTSYLTANFNVGAPSSPSPSTCFINGSPMSGVLNAGYWTIHPDVQPTAGTYTSTLNLIGASNLPPARLGATAGDDTMTITPAMQIGLIKRTNSSSSWLGCGVTTYGQPGTDQGLGSTTTVGGSISGSVVTVSRSSVPSFSDFGVGVEANPTYALPVTLIYFTAEPSGNNALLNWATASETNNAYFAVERSTDGQNFQQIGQVAGHGNSVVTISYQYTDEDITSLGVAVLYYRLKQVDVDGNATYTNIASVDVANANPVFHILATYPNPFTDHLSVSFFAPQSQAIRMSLYDIQGQLVRDENINAETGINVYTLSDASHLASGLYMMNITAGNQNYSIKLVKGE